MSKKFIFTPGLLIRWQHCIWILRRTINGQRYQFENLASGEIDQVSLPQFFKKCGSGEIRVETGAVSESEIQVKMEQNEPLQDISVFGKKAETRILLKLEYIYELRKKKITRGQIQLYPEAIDKVFNRLTMEGTTHRKPSVKTVYNWVCNYEDNGENPAALRDGYDKRGRNPKYTAYEVELANQAIRERYLMHERGDIDDVTSCLTVLVAEANRKRVEDMEPLRSISKSGIRRLIYGVPSYERTVARYGQQYADMLHRAVLHDSDVTRPLELVEIDHTILNLFVVDDELFLPLGRPVLTAVRDKHSGMPLGIHLGFAGESLDAVFGAMRDSLWPKRVRDVFPDIVNDWYEGGTAETYATDNAIAYKSSDYRGACRLLHSHYEFNPIKSGWCKGGVERFLGEQARDLTEKIKGTTFADIMAKGDYDPGKHAVVRFSTFTMLIYKWIVDIYSRSPNQRKQARPIDLWNDGIGKSPIAYRSDRDGLAAALGQTNSGTVSHEGIVISYLNYNSRELSDLLKRYGERSSRSRAVWKTEYRFNKSELWHIFVPVPGEKRYIEVPCVQWEYSYGLTFWMHQHLRKVAAEKLRMKVDIESLAYAKEYVRQIVADELAKKPSMVRKAISRMAGISSDLVKQGKSASVLKMLDQPLSMPEAGAPKIIVPESSFQRGSKIPVFDVDVM